MPRSSSATTLTCGCLRRLDLPAEFRPSPIGAERPAPSSPGPGTGTHGSAGRAGLFRRCRRLRHGEFGAGTAEEFPDVAVEVVPGVTAAMAAAALLGAPLGHDFACISLSDLLTPWEAIEAPSGRGGTGRFRAGPVQPGQQAAHLAAAARARNPVESSPARYAGRPGGPGISAGMHVWQTTLGELTADGIGMETIAIVGNSQTRMVNGRMVTPRGYMGGERGA